jgi:opacity protein-like surface antigen
MSPRTLTSLFAPLSLVAVSLASAQGAPEKPLRWHIEGGYSITTGRTRDYLDNGFLVSGGVDWRQPGRNVGLRAQAHLGVHGASDELIDLGAQQTQLRVDDGSGTMLGLDLNGVLNFPLRAGAHAYLTAGVGVDRRRRVLTQTVLLGGLDCDYWWGDCGFGVVPGDVLVASTSTTRLSWNGGLGVEFPVSSGGSWFVQASYRRIETPEPTVYVPIQVGFKF